GPRPQPADDAGAPGAPRREAGALLAQLSPARPAPGRPAAAPPVLARGRRAGGQRRLRLARGRLARARAVRPHGHPLRGPSESRAPSHGGRLGRSPSAQGLPDRRRARPLLTRRMTATLPHVGRTRRWPIVGDPIYEGSRIPSRVPTIVDVPPSLRESDDVMQVNFGPNHPSTHGVLRLIVDLDGEEVVGLSAVIGYLHTGFEKNMEQKTWWKAITYPERIDYVGYQNNELVFVLAIEKLLELEVPEKATWMRMLLCELNRIHSHLVFLGTSALELGAISMFWYCFRERETVLDLFELVTGQRMHTRYFQAGGLAEDIPRGFFLEARKFVEWMPRAVDEYEALVNRNKIWLERTQGIGLLSRDDALALGQSGPVLRGSGVDWDLRRVFPYLVYA